ncbi:MAG: hypothetical protein ABEK59_01450 [Halobacteria archaeon]
MADKIGSFDHDANSGSTESYKLFPGENGTLLRYENGLDVDVDVEIEATIGEDKANFNKSEDLRVSGGSPGAKTVKSNKYDSDYLTEPWDILKVKVTPASDPTSGTFTLRKMIR